MMNNIPYFKLFFFLGFFLVGKNAQAMENPEYDKEKLSCPMLVRFGTFSDYKKENVNPNLTINPTYFSDYEENIKEADFILSTIFLYKKTIKRDNVLKRISIEFLENAKSYAMTDAYQTQELRQLSNKNFFSRCLLLKAANILYDQPETNKLWEEAKESKKYSVECCDAFLAADEDAGVTYSSQEESDIHQFFYNQLNYMESIEEFYLNSLVTPLKYMTLRTEKQKEDQTATYSRENFLLLLRILQMKYNVQKICDLAGYKHHTMRNLYKMINASPTVQKTRWKNICTSLEKEDLHIQDLLQYSDLEEESSDSNQDSSEES